MAKKKSFTDAPTRSNDNPALAFISKDSIEAVDGEPENPDVMNPPEGYKTNPLYIEKRTQRTQIILQPSLYKKAKAASAKAGISFNELVHRALTAYLED